MSNTDTFDAADFARRVSAKISTYPSLRKAATEAHVPAATLSRVSRGWPDLSLRNFLIISAWLGDEVEIRPAA